MCTCVVQATVAETVYFCHGGKGSIEDCTFGRSEKHGLCIEGAGSTVNATRCDFLLNAECGALASAGGSLKANTCKGSGNKKAGFGFRGSGTLAEFTGCTIQADSRGCVVSDGAKPTATGTSIQGCKKEGVVVSNTGEAVLRQCTVIHCAQGVNVTGGASRVYAENCTVTKNQLECVAIFNNTSCTPHVTHPRAFCKDANSQIQQRCQVWQLWGSLQRLMCTIASSFATNSVVHLQPRARC